MEIRRIVLATDFSPCAREAYGPALDLARKVSAKLDLVHAVDIPDYPFYPFQEPGDPDQLRKKRPELALKLEEEAKLDVFAGATVQAHLLGGHGPDAVCWHAQTSGAGLIVQASHGRSGVIQLLLGSFAEQVLRQSSVPVLTVKSRDEGAAHERFAPERILFPYDFSPSGRRAIDALRFFARVYDAGVIAVHVLSSVLSADERLKRREDLLADLENRLRQFAARELEGIECECRLLEGDPASLIVDCAADADLVCLAAYGWRGVRHRLFGRVAEKVVRGSPCAVLTVRPEQEHE